jgi:hypothetical protein
VGLLATTIAYGSAWTEDNCDDSETERESVFDAAIAWGYRAWCMAREGFEGIRGAIVTCMDRKG